MMFRAFVFVFLILAEVSSAQEVKEYYSEDDQLVSESESYYYLVGSKIANDPIDPKAGWSDSVYMGPVKGYYTKGNKLKSILYYNKGLLQGNFSEYHENGVVKEKGTYEDNRKSGTDTSWYANGQLQRVLRYYTVDREYGWKISKFDILEYWDLSGTQLVKGGNGDCVCLLSDIKLLTESGKVVNGKRDQLWKGLLGDTVKHEEQYKKGELVKGVSYHKGKEYPYTEVEKMAEMNGGMPALMKFLAKSIKYPVDAKRRGKEGKVYIRFVVGKDGLIIEWEILRKVYPSLDEEALRVVRLFDRWVPATLRGIPVKSQFVLPVYFKLSS